jgi:hypothetical protein
MLYFLFLSQFFLISCSVFSGSTVTVGRPLKASSTLRNIFLKNRVYGEKNAKKIVVENNPEAKQKARSDLYDQNLSKKTFVQEYVKYYSDSKIVTEASLNQDTAPVNRNREIFFYLDEVNKVKPVKNIEIVSIARKENFLPVSPVVYSYFENVENATYSDVNAKGQDKNIDYNKIHAMNDIQLNKFYNIN